MAFGTENRLVAGLHRIADDAEALATASDSTWLRVQAVALGAAARAVAGAEPELRAIVDASPPPIDESALARLDELVPGEGSLADRLATHHVATLVPLRALRPSAERLLELLRERAAEDLDLPAEHRLELEAVRMPGTGWRARLRHGPQGQRLVVNASSEWTVDRLVRAITSLGYPGLHLARLMRPSFAAWCPSPETTVERGLAAHGREILLADHELAHELERIGRAAGLSWNGNRIVAVRRALDDLAPAYAAAAALVGGGEMPHDRLAALGADPRTAQELVERWHDPLARASAVARAAGPPLVRAWLVTIGQTAGLQRLLNERLVPTMLRAEIAHDVV